MCVGLSVCLYVCLCSFVCVCVTMVHLTSMAVKCLACGNQPIPRSLPTPLPCVDGQVVEIRSGPLRAPRPPLLLGWWFHHPPNTCIQLSLRSDERHTHKYTPAQFASRYLACGNQPIQRFLPPPLPCVPGLDCQVVEIRSGPPRAPRPPPVLLLGWWFHHSPTACIQLSLRTRAHKCNACVCV